jgi:glycine cleavage system aminomethyltransferase T
MQTLSDYFNTRSLEYLDLAPGVTVPAHFGDWEGEYWAVRRYSGLFDFSFMHTIEVAGEHAIEILEVFQCRKLRTQAINSILYSFILDDHGRTELDITIWRLDHDRFWLIAGRPIKDQFTQFLSQYNVDVKITENTSQYNILAIQGPQSKQILMNTLGCQECALPNFFVFNDVPFFNTSIRIARLGYTGELGYEIIVPKEIAKFLWLKLLSTNTDIRECGFVAANSLRIEAGFLLFANELQQPRFLSELGYERFSNELTPPAEKLVGLSFLTMQPHLDSDLISDLKHSVLPTSRCYSPRMQCDIGLGFCDYSILKSGKKKALTRELEPVELISLPFYRNDKP